MRHVRWAPLLLAAFAGCVADRVRLRPSDGSLGAARYYEIQDEGYDWGDVKVWATLPSANDGEPDVLEARFRIRNDSDQTLSFETREAYADLGVDGRYERLSPEAARTDGVDVGPGRTEEASLRFRLPKGTTLEDVEEFEVNWSLRTPKGRQTRSSAFLLVYEPDDAYYRWASPYAYPYGPSRYWYDPWYW